ncbi:YagK/YfjJ domain-containing protein [Ectopseudomonas composti]|uniref:YagK/YfjJ domain-containing protein n=1 Tax=Ectopseudomonas composti TaxID=658457 RepID=UPI000943718E|nr:inovirus-type Gp2 protein [Pseudomonas composti]
MNNKITYSTTYKGVLINTSHRYKLGAYTAILESIHSQMHALLSHHSRISVLVFVLHTPHGNFSDPQRWNLVVSDFFKSVKQQLGQKDWLCNKDVIYCWAHEQGELDKDHYHCYIGFKQLYRRIGGITSEGYTGLWVMLQTCWKTHSGGYLRPTNAHTVNRNKQGEFNKAFWHISYMAKVRDKTFGTGESYKRFSPSRLKPAKTAPNSCLEFTVSDDVNKKPRINGAFLTASMARHASDSPMTQL